MKTKKIGVVSLLSMGLILSGCGGESSSSSTPEGQVLHPTDITVERGAVYDARVTDASGEIAVEKRGENVYSFTDTPKYPISVAGGWIDVDGDGKKTVADVVLEYPMYSYSNVVTPLTTYLADSDKAVRDAKILALQNRFGSDAVEISNVPSTSTQKAMLLQNALYGKLISNDNNRTRVTLNDVESLFTNLQTTLSQSAGKTDAELRVIVEKEVVDDLVLQNKLTHISLAESDMSSSEKDKYILNEKDFTLTTVPSFSAITDANLLTEYFSNELTFSGIDVPLNISLSNGAFTLIKNDTPLTTSTTTLEDGDRVKLSYTTSGVFDDAQSSSLLIANEFTQELSDVLNYSSAESACRSVGLVLPTAQELETYAASNAEKLFQSSYWVSDSYTGSGYKYKYNVNTKYKSLSGTLATYGVICAKIYEPATFSIKTKSDPNQAPVANAGVDTKVYYTDSVTLDASLSSDDIAIASYEWKEGSVVLSNSISFSKSDFSIGVHTLTLTVTDDAGKSASDTIVVTLYNSFVDILPMDEVGGSKSVSSYSNGGLSTITLGAGSQLYFKIRNDLDRNFTVSKFSIVSTYNGSDTVRSSSTDSVLLSNGTLTPGESISLGYTLSSSQVANYWVGTYELTDTLTGETFTNSFTWSGIVW